ncbi:MAG TPA: hypothetical protein VHC97_13535 [Thermoanaerobaculia bacterium]|jgi:hypothetical protein|nr:hypothetical protein [Thermoanaerobaculia bacterium]
MPQIKSFADLIRDWDKLLAACRDNSEALASVEPQRLALENLLAQGREMKNRQDALAAQKQLATQELDALKEQGKEAARRLRGAVKSLLGSRSELLVQFNVAPLRKRGPRKVFVKPPAAPGTPVIIPAVTPAVMPTTGSPPPTQ